jgi:hypothetical protein
MRRRQFVLLTLAAAVQVPAVAADIPIRIYRNPNCGCCDVYAGYLKRNGFNVELIDTLDAALIHQKYAVPERLEGCHTAVAGNYVFEGLIPAEHVKRVISEKRPIRGLSVPGMPLGAPGMPGTARAPIHVYYLEDTSSPKIFATFS